MLSRPRKPPSKTLLPRAVLAVHPPREVDQQLLEHAGKELMIPAAVDLEHAQSRPGVHRRVHVAEGPLVRGDLSVGVHVPLTQHEDQLLLGERRVHVGQRHAVEGQVPRGVPGVLPRVGHRDHVSVVEVAPPTVAAVPACQRRRRAGGIAVEPLLHVVVVELLAPHEPGDRLAQHTGLVGRRAGRGEGGEVGVRLRLARGDDLVEALPEVGVGHVATGPGEGEAAPGHRPAPSGCSARRPSSRVLPGSPSPRRARRGR